jgi:hypothetical protein
MLIFSPENLMAKPAPHARSSSLKKATANGKVQVLTSRLLASGTDSHMGLPQARWEYLREALPVTAALLAQRRANQIEEGVIDDYVTLQWLEWHGGGLRLTITGTNVCAQVAQSLR